MLIFRFDYALLISTVISVTALIPVAGAYIGGAVAFILLAIISPIKAVMFIVYLVILQQIETNLIYPRVVGSSLELPGIWVIFAVTVGGVFVITLNSDQPNILNYERNLQNKYASWEQELTQREQTVREKERELHIENTGNTGNTETEVSQN